MTFREARKRKEELELQELLQDQDATVHPLVCRSLY